MKTKKIKKSTLPSFLTKLYEILENEEYNTIITWTENGKAFIVQNLSEFIDKVLPLYFKHSNFASFVRQLNMYDFHKSRNDPDECSFYHKKFNQGKKHLLKSIKRKVNHFSTQNENNMAIVIPQSNKTEKLLDDILKKQNILEDKYNSLMSSRQDLYKEKEDRLNYEKNLQMLLLLLIQKYSKIVECNKVNEANIFSNCLSNLEENIVNMLIEKAMTTGLDIDFLVFEGSCSPKNFKDKSIINKLSQLKTNTNKNVHNQSVFKKDNVGLNLTDEVNSVTQCVISTPTLSPPQTSLRYSNNEFCDIEMFSTPNQISLYDDMIF